MTEPQKDSKVLDSFNKAYRDDAAKKALATRAWLLGHMQRSIPIRIVDKRIEIRERLTPEEQKLFPDVFAVWTPGGQAKLVKKTNTKAGMEKYNQQFREFVAHIVTEPADLKPEDIDKAFHNVEQTAIISEFFKTILSDVDAETLQLFR